MGDKSKAKETMKSAGVPVIPGNEGVLNNVDETKIIASKIGYPVMLKASAGGLFVFVISMLPLRLSYYYIMFIVYFIC